MRRKVLVVAAHPDDEILGCGGTMKKLADQNFSVFTLILGEGITARGERRDKEGRIGQLKQLKEQVYKANHVVGVRRVFTHDFPDNRFDSVPLLDIVKIVEKVKREVGPEVIFTHHINDLNIDHKITCQAVMTATRPLPRETVKEIYSFEVLSSTEWSYPLSFSPDTFYDITDTFLEKTRAMKIYRGELKPFPHPRSLKSIGLNAQRWGIYVGVKYAEAFMTMRAIR